MNRVRFKSLYLEHPSQGLPWSFEFNERKTYIQGNPGSGLSTIARALHEGTGVTVSGNRTLIQRFQNLLIIDESSKFSFDGFEFSAPSSPRLFIALNSHSWDLYEEMSGSRRPENWRRFLSESDSERQCAVLSKAIAIRKVMGIDLPFIFDGAPSLEPKHFDGVRRVLARQQSQLIAFGYSRVHPVFGEADYYLRPRT